MGPISLIYITLTYMGGIILEHFAELPVVFYLFASVLFIILGIYRMRRTILPRRNYYLFAIFIILGGLNLAIRTSPPPPSHIIHLTGEYVTLVGNLSREPEYLGSRAYLVIKVEEAEGRPACGSIRVTLDGSRPGDFKYGERLKFHSKL